MITANSITTAEALAELKGLPLGVVEAMVAGSQPGYIREVHRSMVAIDEWQSLVVEQLIAQRAGTRGWRLIGPTLFDPVETTFKHSAERWRNETAAISSVTARAMHPAYQRIIGLGPAVIPMILRELRSRPDHWFWALNAITGEQPVAEGANFSDAVATWLAWGNERGLV
jgi:hypothetical protein